MSASLGAWPAWSGARAPTRCRCLCAQPPRWTVGRPASAAGTGRTQRSGFRVALTGLFAGGGEILRLARPASRSSGFRMRGPSGHAPAAGPDHRLWETAVLFHLRDAFRAGDVWLARSHRYGDIRRRCCRLPPSLMPTAACRLRPVRTTGSPSAGSLSTRACAGWPPRRGPVRSLAEASKTACSASRGRKPPCWTGPLTWSPGPLPADARGAAGRTPGPRLAARLGAHQPDRGIPLAGRRPSGTAKRLGQ